MPPWKSTVTLYWLYVGYDIEGFSYVVQDDSLQPGIHSEVCMKYFPTNEASIQTHAVYLYHTTPLINDYMNKNQDYSQLINLK